MNSQKNNRPKPSIKKGILIYALVFLCSGCTPFGEFSKFSFFDNTDHSLMMVNDKGAPPTLRETNLIEWSAAPELLSAVTRYEVALGNSPGASNTSQGWITTSGTSYKFTIDLVPSALYYASVRITFDGKTKVFTSSGFTAPANKAQGIFAQANSSCAIDRLGQIKCWGENFAGELGYDDTITRGNTSGSMALLPTVNLGFGRSAKSIDLGDGHTCAMLDNDQIKCWGYNGAGQLGYDDTNNRGNTAGSMALLSTVNLGPGRSAKSIALGSSHSCAVLDNNQIKCWGANWYGQLGYDDAISRGNTAGSMALLSTVNLGAGRSAKSIALGRVHSCAVLDNNQIKCWGDNSSGQLGYDDTINRGDTVGSMASFSTVNLGAGRSAKSIALGGYHSCAVLDNDQIKCWGHNGYGQLGYGDTIARGNTAGGMALLSTVNLGAGRSAKSIALEGSHSCAVLDNDQIKCWGYNEYGQLGYDDPIVRGDSAGSMALLSAVNLGVGRSAKSITLGYTHTCAVLDNDQIKCWGDNSFGQLGYDDMINRGNTAGSMALLSTVNLGAGRSAKSIASGNYHSCAVLDNDQIKCWGANWYGQLGYDDAISRGNTAGSMASLSTVNLGAGRSAKSIALGRAHSCAVLDNDQIKCWGHNGYGQLGYGDTIARGNTAGSMALLSTVNLGAGRSAKNIALGDDHSCAVLDNNQIKCWGDNSSGQLGYDDTINRGSTAGSMALLSTVNLGAGRSAKSIALGRAHSCAVLDNDQIKCWGYNSTGELGYNNQIYSGAYAGSMALFPTVNLGVGRSVKRIELGGYHTCALLDNDQIKCWGYNGYGQLGYDNTEIRGTSFSITEDSGNLFAP